MKPGIRKARIREYSRSPRIMLGFPGSGNNWLRYIIECLYAIPTKAPECEWPESHPIDQNCPFNLQCCSIKLISGCEPVYHCHLPQYNTLPDRDQLSMICLVRDYSEFIMRTLSKKPKKLTVAQIIRKWHNDGYYPTIAVYDQHPMDKMLIYYEDLINPDKFPDLICRLDDLFGPKLKTKTKNFLELWSYHMQHSLNIYGSYKKLTTGGREESGYAHELDPDTKDIIDEVTRECNPGLYDKYLLRYKREEND